MSGAAAGAPADAELETSRPEFADDVRVFATRGRRDLLYFLDLNIHLLTKSRFHLREYDWFFLNPCYRVINYDLDVNKVLGFLNDLVL